MKKIISFLIAACLIFTYQLSYAANDMLLCEKKAEVLRELNILKGDEHGFRLNENPTRIEAVIVMLRLEGNEGHAIEKNLHHPFADVPEWASPYAAYAYATALTSGVSENEFGTDEKLTANQFVSFVLRTLGYNDLKGDFSVDSAVDFATEQKIISSPIENGEFTRGDMVTVLYDVLGAKIKDSNTEFSKKLKALGVFTDEDEINATKIIADFVS